MLLATGLCERLLNAKLSLSLSLILTFIRASLTMTNQLDDAALLPHDHEHGAAASNDLPYTDHDILLKKGGRTSLRQANQLYHDFLKSNYMIYCCLPAVERRPFARNIFLYIRRILGRRFIKYNQSTNEYYELEEDVTNKRNDVVEAISAAIRAEWVKVQASKRWVVGNHDPRGFHNGNPFLYKVAHSIWRKPPLEEVNRILERTPNGLTELLILPAGVRHDPQDDMLNFDALDLAQHRHSHTDTGVDASTGEAGSVPGFDFGGEDDLFPLHSSQSQSAAQGNDAN